MCSQSCNQIKLATEVFLHRIFWYTKPQTSHEGSFHQNLGYLVVVWGTKILVIFSFVWLFISIAFSERVRYN